MHTKTVVFVHICRHYFMCGLHIFTLLQGGTTTLIFQPVKVRSWYNLVIYFGHVFVHYNRSGHCNLYYNSYLLSHWREWYLKYPATAKEYFFDYLRSVVIPCVFSSTTTKTITKMTKTFWIIVDEAKTKTKIKTRDKRQERNRNQWYFSPDILLTRISEAKFGT